MEQRELDEIIKAHEVWLESNGREGSKANLRGRNLEGLTFHRANMHGANMKGASFSQADLRGADLRGANLQWSKMASTDLRDADMRGVDMRGADMWGADMRDATLPEKTFLIHGESYWIMIQNGDHLRAGCQCHSIKAWREFTKEEIEAMDGKEALKFYPRLLDIADFYTGKSARPDWLKGEQ